jgi:hypothetical protein
MARIFAILASCSAFSSAAYKNHAIDQAIDQSLDQAIALAIDPAIGQVP